VSDALTDFTDLLPTFCELGGAEVPADLKIDGVSIAPVLLGKAKDSPREWILAMGHGAARLDEQGVRGVEDFAERGIRDKRYKVWVTPQREISRLHDLQTDPHEQTNLVDSTQPEHIAALAKFKKIVDSLPAVDARPSYEPRAANAWDRSPRTTKQPAKNRKKKERRAKSES
jgi:arylsulfatase A-like enzyme